MQLKKIILSLFVVMLTFSTNIFSQDDLSYLELQDNPFLDLNLDQLFQLKLEIGSVKAQSQRDIPSIVSVITKEEIINSGAKDLLEVLTLFVPGVNFGADVEGAVGMGIRGFWTHEGKLLLMIDGQECNEEMFATTVFGNHYPVDIIERVEMIRGPGSSIYGGYAAVAVINIITKGATTPDNNVFVNASYSQMKETYANRNIVIGSSKKADSYSYSIVGAFGEGVRSDKDNIDYYGGIINLEDNSDIKTNYLNCNLKAYNFDARFIVDQYHITQVDLWGENYLNGAIKEEWDSYFFNLKYKYEVNDSLQFIPEFKYKKQYPWQVKVYDQEYTNEKDTEKYQYLITGIWDVNEKNNIVFGMEYYTNYINMPDNPSIYEETFANNKSELGYENFSSFAQWMIQNDIVNITIGGRYDNSTEYDSSFVPRIGFTKSWDKFHTKFMYSESFRLPGGIIANRIPDGAPDIEPETADNYEIEFGYQATEKSYFSINLYDIKFKDVIIYQSNPETGVGSYYNSGEFGARGFESEFKYQISQKATILVNYSYYKISDNNVAIYAVPSEDNQFLGMPQHRFNVYSNINITENFSITPTLSFYGERYGYAYDEALGYATLNKYDNETVFNINCRVKKFINDDMELNFGIRDLFESDYEFIQPYDGGHAPLPSQSRSIYIKFTYVM